MEAKQRCERDELPNVQYVEANESTMLPAEGPAANLGEELTGKDDEHVLDGSLPDAATLDAVS